MNVSTIIKGKLSGAVGPILIDIGKDFIAAVAPELYPLVLEWWNQRSTADGWTDKERLTYLYAMVNRIKQKEIGPSYVDSAIDWALQTLLKHIAEDLDKLEATPVDVPPVDVPPAEHVEKPYYGQMTPEKPTVFDAATDQLWWNQATNPVAIRYMILGNWQIGFPGWDRCDW